MNRNQELQQYTGWLHTVAHNMHDSNNLHDDLVQEGYIAMWKALGSHNPNFGSQDAYVKTAAIYRMRSILAGKKMTTDEPRRTTEGFRTKRGDETRERIAAYMDANPNATGSGCAAALRLSPGTVSVQLKKLRAPTNPERLEQKELSLEEIELEGPDHLEHIFAAYHAGEIAEAIGNLTPAQQKYVYARFWEGLSHSERKARFGYDPESMWYKIKPKLVEHLEHLRELSYAD